MIVRPAPGGGTLFLRQVDHAALCGPWARAWRWPLTHRAETAEAAGFHDNGWMEADERPGVDGEGRPHDYRSIPDAAYAEIWSRGFSRAWARSPWIGTLVSLHGCAFLQHRRDAQAREMVAAERARREAAGQTDAARPAAAVVRWLDGLSLFLCEEWSSPWRARADGEWVTAARGEEWVTLTPWPFEVEHLEARVPATRVDQTRWETGEDLVSDLDGGARTELRWTLKPA